MVDTGRRGPFYLITGLLIGLVLGFFYGWVINPARYIDISPQSLHEDQKKQYLLLVAESYQASEDIGRSYARIKQMVDPVDIDSLRAILLDMEIDPSYSDSFETVRDFINSLNTYTQVMGGVFPDNQSTAVAQPFQDPAEPDMFFDQQEVSEQSGSPSATTNEPISGQATSADFFVISN